jgi:hypothetical protein
MQKIVNGNWTDCTEEDLTVGEQYRISVGGGWEQKAYSLPVEDAPSTRISTYAFLDRHTDEEAMVIDLASIDDPGADPAARMVSAAIRRMHSKISAASFIDLADPKTIAGNGVLVALGLLTAERGDEILNAPITEKEQRS